MARKIRIEYAGAAYHVVARGNQGRDIYADDRDRKLWLETLREACEKTGWRIHAWVMMNNHYHLLLETPEANLVAGRGISGAVPAIGNEPGRATLPVASAVLGQAQDMVLFLAFLA